MKIYKIELGGSAIVAADSEDEARRVLSLHWREIMNECAVDEFLEEITDGLQLTDEWGEECLPYRLPTSYGELTIGEILKRNAEAQK